MKTIAAIVLCLTVFANAKQPNIFLVVMDDVGFNDVGWNNSPDIKTPYMDNLAATEGRVLRNYFTQSMCTPSRVQLMFGIHEARVGLQHDVLRGAQRNGVPLQWPSVADELRELGYSTHMMGKWHLGHFDKHYTPYYRGFDSYLGELNGLGRQISHTASELYKVTSTGKFYNSSGHDFWLNDEPNYDYEGQYTTELFTQRVIDLVDDQLENNPDKPLFFYISYTGSHSPLEVPDNYLEQYEDIEDPNRRYYAAAMSAIDQGVENITEHLKKVGMWENSFMVVSTDNGGVVNFGGDNHPYRGQKDTSWDGGYRGCAMVASGLFRDAVKGKPSDDWLHISDWYPTFVAMAGGDTSGQTLDGHNQWDTLNGEAESPRTEMFYNIDPLYKLTGTARANSPFDTRYMAAIRKGNYKLVTGAPAESDWFITPTQLPDEPVHPRNMSWWPVSGYGEYEDGYVYKESEDPADKNLWLFDISKDPYEENDISADNDDIVQELLELLDHYNKTLTVTPQDQRCDYWGAPQSRGSDVLGPWVVNGKPDPQF